MVFAPEEHTGKSKLVVCQARDELIKARRDLMQMKDVVICEREEQAAACGDTAVHCVDTKYRQIGHTKRRIRALGGTSNAWAGYIAPLDDRGDVSSSELNCCMITR